MVETNKNNDRSNHGAANNKKEIFGRLALGTAQLGMPYGIANTHGKPAYEKAADIINTAWQKGIRYYDTAQSYGESEKVLGKVFCDCCKDEKPLIVTKTDPNARETKDVAMSIQSSLNNLQAESLWGVMLHREEFLDEWDEKWGPELNSIRSAGLVSHIGVSVYSPERAIKAGECKGLDIIQLPANVFDRRMMRSKVVERLNYWGIKVFIRSIFLQGLVLMEPRNLPPKMQFAKPALETLNRFCAEQDLDKQYFVIHYLLRRYPQAVIIFGAETPEQVLENSRIMEQDMIAAEKCRLWDQIYPEDNHRLLNPRLW